jgi:hypothetical protein
VRLIPSSEVALPGGIRCVPRAVAVPPWQAHVLKHPLGVNGVRRTRSLDGWNGEQWDATSPPVVDAAGRAEAQAKIAALGDVHQRCAVPEVRGAVGTAEEPECYGCGEPLVLGCARLLADVGDRYAGVIDEVVAAMRDASLVPRARLTGFLYAKVRTPAIWADLVVLSTGKAPRSKGSIIRISRGDGVRVELTLDGAHRAAWRTCYREPNAVGLRGLSFLTDSPLPDRSIPLSDQYAVPRGWWERHGS